MKTEPTSAHELWLLYGQLPFITTYIHNEKIIEDDIICIVSHDVVEDTMCVTSNILKLMEEKNIIITIHFKGIIRHKPRELDN